MSRQRDGFRVRAVRISGVSLGMSAVLLASQAGCMELDADQAGDDSEVLVEDWRDDKDRLPEGVRPVADGETVYDRVHDFESLAEYAAELSKTPFEPAPPMPEDVRNLDYDDYRLISFWPNEAYWRRSGTPFQLETFHRGYIFFERVRIHLLSEADDGTAMTLELPYEESRYDYRGKLEGALEIPADTGHAGLKINGTLPSSLQMQELMSFIGASYFRNLSEGQVYGTSARGLGVDMGMNKPEEFPCFRDFWVVTPPANDSDGNGEFDGPAGSGELRVLAALDSPSLTGAYEFRLRPGVTSEVDVRARLFMRFHPQKLCVAPMSSMWMWGDGVAPPSGETRPKVHDADGLLTLDGDDHWTFRPLAKQSYPSVSSFKFEDLRGFGLLQRDRAYDHYRDDEAKYDRRPSVWIEPLSANGTSPASTVGFGAGHVELFEMPADHEGYDNIACWFVPQADLQPGDTYELNYRVSMPSGDPDRHGIAKAVRTSVSHGEDGTTVAVTFRGGRLGGRQPTSSVPVSLTGGESSAAGDSANRVADSGEPTSRSEGRQATRPATTDSNTPGQGGPVAGHTPSVANVTGLSARVKAGEGGVEELSIGPSGPGEVTLTLRFRGKPDGPTELRAELLSEGQPVAETWRYLCPPN